MILKPNGSHASIHAPEEWFTGRVRVDPIHMEAQEPSRITSALVTFRTGVRSNRHTHPLGQLLIVTSGKGWTQCEGEGRVGINAGDMVWWPLVMNTGTVPHPPRGCGTYRYRKCHTERLSSGFGRPPTNSMENDVISRMRGG